MKLEKRHVDVTAKQEEAFTSPNNWWYLFSWWIMLTLQGAVLTLDMTAGGKKKLKKTKTPSSDEGHEMWRKSLENVQLVERNLNFDMVSSHMSQY